jgi:23S rRNA pseudouridine955/2504/2580 synthase
MFLHAAELTFAHPTTGAALALSAPLPDDLQRFLDALANPSTEHAAPV